MKSVLLFIKGPKPIELGSITLEQLSVARFHFSLLPPRGGVEEDINRAYYISVLRFRVTNETNFGE